MIDEEFIEKIFDGTYINPRIVNMIQSVYKNNEENGFVFYINTNYDELQSVSFKTKREAVESRERLIKIVHFSHEK